MLRLTTVSLASGVRDEEKLDRIWRWLFQLTCVLVVTLPRMGRAIEKKNTLLNSSVLHRNSALLDKVQSSDPQGTWGVGERDNGGMNPADI